MLGVLYGAIPAVILFFQGIGFKVYSVKGSLKSNESFFNLWNFLICFVITLPFAFACSPFDPMSVAYGAVHGLLFAAMVFFYNKAMTCGKIAFNNFVMALSMIIPIVFGAVILNETIGVLQWIGLAVFFVASYLMCFGQKSAKDVKVPKISYLYITLAAICSGCVSLIIKFFYDIYPDINQYQYLDSAFLTAAVIMLVITASLTKFRGLKEYIADKWFIICVAAVGAATAFGNITFNVFSVKVDGAVFYPVANGLPMILGAAVSPLFKEKISVMSAVGIVFGVAAVVLLNI